MRPRPPPIHGLKALIERRRAERASLSTRWKNCVKKFDLVGRRNSTPIFTGDVESAALGARGTVVPVVQAGYIIGDRVLRPAFGGASPGWREAGAAEQG